MAHDVARSRREPGGNPRRSVVFPEEGVVVHVRGWIGPRADSAGAVQAGMVQVETDLGDEGGGGMPVDADPVPSRDVRLGRQRRGLMASVLQRPSEFAQVPPRLQLQGVGREGLGEDRDPKGFHGSAPHRGPWEGTAQAGQEIGTRAKGYRLFPRPRVARLPSDVVRGLKRISNKASGYLSLGGGSTCGS